MNTFILFLLSVFAVLNVHAKSDAQSSHSLDSGTRVFARTDLKSSSVETFQYSGSVIQKSVDTGSGSVVVIVLNDKSYPVNVVVNFGGSSIQEGVIPPRGSFTRSVASNPNEYVSIHISSQSTGSPVAGLITVRYEN